MQHELGHYLRLYLENIKADNCFFDVGSKLINLGVSQDYTKVLPQIWTNSEELTAIFGIIYVNNDLFYDNLNQSEFNLIYHKGIRYAHDNSRYNIVPYNLFCVVFKESLLKLRFPYEVIYNKSVAEIL